MAFFVSVTQPIMLPSLADFVISKAFRNETSLFENINRFLDQLSLWKPSHCVYC